MRLRTIFRQWLPLAVSFELMMLEGPTVQGAIGRLPNSTPNLAAWGLTMSLSLLIESPVIMLLATAIALVVDRDSFRALRRFMLTLAGGCTLLTALVVFTPLFDIIAHRWMGQPPAIVAAARPAMQLMLFWTAAIAWRRFYQGILVRHGQTRKVSWGTMFRLTTAVSLSIILALVGRMSGVQVAAVAIMTAVLTEAVVTTLFVRSVLREDLAVARDDGRPPLTQRAIWRFHAPLAATTLLTLLAQPMTSAALARLGASVLNLAVWPVVFMLLLVIRGWGLALQESTIALARHGESQSTLRRFAWLVGGLSSVVTVVIVLTPLLDIYLKRVIHLSPSLWPYAHLGCAVCVLLPLVTALSAWARGVLVARGTPKAVYQGMSVNLTTHAALLVVGVALRLPGMWVAAGAFSLANMAEYAYLARRVAALDAMARAVVPILEEEALAAPVEA